MQKVRLKLGEKHAELLSQHRGVAYVAEMVFGKKEDGPGGIKPGQNGVKDLAAGHQSPEAAAAAINRALAM